MNPWSFIQCPEGEKAAGKAAGKAAAKAGGKAASAKAAAKKTVDEAFQESVTIPVMVNKDRVASGDELLIYRQKAPKRTKEPEAISVSKLAKKAMK